MELFPLDVDPSDSAATSRAADRIDRKCAISLSHKLLDAVRKSLTVCELAGSARRLKPTVKDLEFVCIEREPGSLKRAICRFYFDNQKDPRAFLELCGPKQIRIAETVYKNTTNTVRPEFLLKIEFFISQPEYFGWTYFIRTGSHEWNKAVLLQLNKRGYTSKDNVLVNLRKKESMQISDERQVFDLLGIPFVEPHLRHDENALRKAFYNARVKFL